MNQSMNAGYGNQHPMGNYVQPPPTYQAADHNPNASMGANELQQHLSQMNNPGQQPQWMQPYAQQQSPAQGYGGFQSQHASSPQPPVGGQQQNNNMWLQQ